MSSPYQLTLKYLTNELLFTPVVDQAFIPDLPVEIIKRQEFRSVPTLLGTNEDEGTLIALRAYPSYVLRQNPPTVTLEDFIKLLPDYLFYYTPMLAAATEQWYIDWTQADDSAANQVNAFIKLNTDQVLSKREAATLKTESNTNINKHYLALEIIWLRFFLF